MQSTNRNPLNTGVMTVNSEEVGEISAEMLEERANELALIAGHAATEAEYEQARRELTGGSAMDPHQALLESVPETQRWDPVPGSSGIQAPESASEDESEEGLSESAQLYEEGVREAEHDQMLQAALLAKNKDLLTR